MTGLQDLLRDGRYSIVGLTGSDADYSVLIERATGRVYHAPHQQCQQSEEHDGKECGLVVVPRRSE